NAAAFAQFIDAKRVGGPKDGNGGYEDIDKLVIAGNNTMLLKCLLGVFRSISNGISWSAIADGIYCEFFLAADHTLYLASDTAVFSSTNFGTTWNNLSSELPNGPFYSI